VTRDFASDVERNEIVEKCDQRQREAAQCTPVRAMYELENNASEIRQRHSFHKARILRKGHANL
jgi:hypothetical protein